MRKTYKYCFRAAAALATVNVSAITGFYYHKLPPILTDFLVVAGSIVFVKNLVEIIVVPFIRNNNIKPPSLRKGRDPH